jgi:drug/metabolite transporter (DMT)-like permease
VLAAVSAAGFGGFAVALRAVFRTDADSELVTLATTLGALLVSLAVSVAWLPGLDWHGAWPFLCAGLIAPGLSQLFFSRAVQAVGASRTAILIGISPVLSALFAITLLGEPVRAGLVVGTALIVAGGLALGWERSWPGRARAIGIAAGAAAATLIAARDNFVRWAVTGNDVAGPVVATLTLVSASAALALIVAAAGKGGAWRGLVPAWRPLLLSALLFGLAYDAVFTAFDHGRVTVVAPLYATESLWAVLLAALLLRRAEALHRSVLVAAVFIVAGGAFIGAAR